MTTTKTLTEQRDEAWMHAAMKSSQFSSNSHDQDKIRKRRGEK